VCRMPHSVMPRGRAEARKKGILGVAEKGRRLSRKSKKGRKYTQIKRNGKVVSGNPASLPKRSCPRHRFNLDGTMLILSRASLRLEKCVVRRLAWESKKSKGGLHGTGEKKP